MQKDIETYDINLSNGTVGEVEISKAFIEKLRAAGYTEEQLSDSKNLLNIICQLALNAKATEEA
jgi:hypothetical protein